MFLNEVRERLSSKIDSPFVSNAILERPQIGCVNFYTQSHLWHIVVPACGNGWKKECIMKETCMKKIIIHNLVLARCEE